MSKKELTAATLKAAIPMAQEFIDFVNESVTPFHAVKSLVSQLTAKGYTKLPDAAPWPPLTPGQRAYFTRADSSIVAFRVGSKFSPGNGMKIMGAHTDSPNFQVKPKSDSKKGGFVNVGVQCYGGGLWHTWFDRQLTVAGRVVVQKTTGGLESRLVRVPKGILLLPTLCVHLRSQAERDAFAPNKESHLIPLIATKAAADAVASSLNAKTPAGQSPLLFDVLSKELGCAPSEILDFDLSIVDTQPATIAGCLDEFVCAPRIDNLLSCFCATKALLDSEASNDSDDMISVVACFDHEEVGSHSAQGAGGSMVTELLEYVTNGDARTKITTVSNSFLLSVDGAHGAHPLYMDKHEENHRPQLHDGPVIKYNANVRYATNGATASKLRAIAALVDVPLQQFCVKNDSPCGSTIGPILSTLTGIRAVDIGNPMLSMHSIRETCGTVDIKYLTELLTAFLTRFKEVPLEEL